MAQSFEKDLHEWLYSFNKSEKRELDGMNIKVLASFRFIKLDLNFLHAAIGLWDAQTHVFRFKIDEICPLPEEFGAIIG